MALAAVALGFSSCKEDRGPKYHDPSEFVLNQPAMMNQYIDLAEGNTLELVASQPDYGYSAIANYSAELSLTEDFATFEAVTPTDVHQARMTFKQEDIALAMCTLLGIEGEDSFKEMYPDGVMPYMTVYFRGVCQLEGVSGSLITSNVVKYNNIRGYLAVATPGYIYLVGNPEGWSGPEESNAAHYAPWRLFEPEAAIGSKIYVGVFNLPSAPMFRFYTALTGWDADSYGTQVDDNPIDYPEFTGDDEFTAPLVKGKGSYNFPNFPGGTVTITVNMSEDNNYTVTIVAGEQTPVITQYVYMVGNNGGWVTPDPGTYEDWKLEGDAGTGVFTGTFTLPSLDADGGSLYCRFYRELTGWGQAQWSSDAGGANIDCAPGVAYPTFPGEGCFVVANAGGKTIQVVLDTKAEQVTFTFVN